MSSNKRWYPDDYKASEFREEPPASKRSAFHPPLESPFAHFPLNLGDIVGGSSLYSGRNDSVSEDLKRNRNNEVSRTYTDDLKWSGPNDSTGLLDLPQRLSEEFRWNRSSELTRNLESSQKAVDDFRSNKSSETFRDMEISQRLSDDFRWNRSSDLGRRDLDISQRTLEDLRWNRNQTVRELTDIPQRSSDVENWQITQNRHESSTSSGNFRWSRLGEQVRDPDDPVALIPEKTEAWSPDRSLGGGRGCSLSGRSISLIDIEVPTRSEDAAFEPHMERTLGRQPIHSRGESTTSTQFQSGRSRSMTDEDEPEPANHDYYESTNKSSNNHPMCRTKKVWYYLRAPRQEEPYGKLVASLFLEAYLSDLMLVCSKNRHEIFVHKFLLAALSSKLNEKFKMEPNLNHIELDFRPDRVKHFLRAIYKGESIVTHSELAHCLQIANFLGIEGIVYEECPPISECPPAIQQIIIQHTKNAKGKPQKADRGGVSNSRTDNFSSRFDPTQGIMSPTDDSRWGRSTEVARAPDLLLASNRRSPEKTNTWPQLSHSFEIPPNTFQPVGHTVTNDILEHMNPEPLTQRENNFHSTESAATINNSYPNGENKKLWFYLKGPLLEEQHRKQAPGLLFSQHRSDLTLLCHTKRIYVHKFILAPISPMLNKRFCRERYLKEIQFDFKPSLTEKVLRAVYNGRSVVTHIQLGYCLEIIDALGIQGMTHEECPPYEECPKDVKHIMNTYFPKRRGMPAPALGRSEGEVSNKPTKARGKYLCQLCGKDFDKETWCQAHEILSHGSRYSQCLVCTKLMIDDKSLERHMSESHTREQMEISHPATEQELRQPGANGKYDTCEKCFQQFPKRLMPQHLWFMHRISFYPCIVCTKVFASEDVAMNHMRFHHAKVLKTY